MVALNLADFAKNDQVKEPIVKQDKELQVANNIPMKEKSEEDVTSSKVLNLTDFTGIEKQATQPFTDEQKVEELTNINPATKVDSSLTPEQKAFSEESFMDRVKSFPQRLTDEISDYWQKSLSEAGAKLPEKIPETGTKEFDELATKELAAPFTEVLPQTVMGIADFLIAKPSLLASTGMINVLENLGLMDKTSAKTKKQWRDELEQNFSTLGGLLETKTATGTLGLRAIETAMLPIVKFVESRKASLGLGKEFAKKYPNLNDAISFGGEFLAFAAVPKIKSRLKALEGKTGKALTEAENNLFDKAEGVLKKNKNNIKDVVTEYQDKIVSRAKAARERVSEVPEGIEAPTAESLARMTPEQRLATEQYQRSFIPDTRAESLKPETALERQARLEANQPELTRPKLGPEPISASSPAIKPEAKPAQKFELSTEEGIPKREFQIDSKTGKISEVNKITERKSYQVDPETGKVVQTENIPGQRKVFRIIQESPAKTIFDHITQPLQNQEGVIRIPGSRKKIIERIPEEQKETVRQLSKAASNIGKTFEDFLKANDFNTKEIKQLSAIEEAIKIERPFEAGQAVAKMPEGSDPLLYDPAETNVNTTKLANPARPIGESVTNALSSAKRMNPKTMPQHIKNYLAKTAPTLHRFRQFESPFLIDLWHKFNEIKVAENKDLKTVETLVKDLQKTFRDVSKRKEAGVFGHARSVSGRKAMEIQGEKIPEAVEYQGLLDKLEGHYQDLFNRINEIRVANGHKPIRAMVDEAGNNVYQPFFLQESLFADLFRRDKTGKFKGKEPNIVADSLTEIEQRHSPGTVNATNFAHIKRYGLDRGKKLELDPIKLFAKYAETSIRHIHRTPMNTFLKEIISKPLKDPNLKRTFLLKNYNPELHSTLTTWNNKIAGLQNIEFPKALIPVEKALKVMSNNLTTAVLGASARTIVIQPTALLNTWGEFGNTNMIRGLAETFKKSPGRIREYYKGNFAKTNDPIFKSNVMRTRIGDVFLQPIAKAIGGNKVVNAYRNFREVAMEGLKFTDYVTAEIAWRTAFESVKGKMTEANAIRFADETVVRQHGSGAPTDLSPLQMNTYGKSLLLWQTFVINNAHFIAKDILGIKNPEVRPMETARRIGYFFVGSALINYLMEEQVGVTSPLPAPEMAIYNGLKNGDKAAAIALKTFLEMTEFVPGMSSIKYGSSPFGAQIQFVEDLTQVFSADAYGRVTLLNAIEGDPTALTKVAELFGKTVGIPGTMQGVKYVRGKKRGSNDFEAILGSYKKGQSSGKRPSMRRRKSYRR